jgi:RecG-like helicase
MVIENPERLGLAQLHQLRGRVGRGSVQSTCVLLYQPPLSALARDRLEVLRASNDGFVIAEKDLSDGRSEKEKILEMLEKKQREELEEIKEMN